MNIVMKTLVMSVMVCLQTLAQQARLQISHLDRLAPKASEVVDVTLDGAALKMANKFIKDQPDMLAATHGVQGIYVKCFEFDQPGVYTPEDVAIIRAQLQGWARIVHVKEKDGSAVEVFTLADDQGRNQGMVVLSAEPKELVLVNIVGSVDLEKLGSLQGKFGIPSVKTPTPKTPKKNGV